jgi:hypothetical protein
MVSDETRLCFVIMGFGKKTDFESGRLLDLDATYESIIQPAVEAAGLRCIRADEIKHSGVIDVEMFEMLLRAELVVADISTGNPNALYELGVRHGLCPNSTIVMKEDAGRLYFDLDHLNTFEYHHLGDDIGSREAKRATRDLGALIAQVLAAGKPDSPVYTFMPRLRRPSLSDEEFAELVEEKEAEQEHLSNLMRQGKEAGLASDHGAAAAAYRAADRLKPHDPFVIQQLALATYKSKRPDEVSALIEGLSIIAALDPDRSNDPETRGITGAMHKRLWLTTGAPAQLDMAIRHYRRGFEVRGDYYNGENLAACYDMRAPLHQDRDESLYDRLSARKVREEIVANLRTLVEDPTTEERADLRWIYATLANCTLSIGDDVAAATYEAEFRARAAADWEVATFELGKEQMLAARARPRDG